MFHSNLQISRGSVYLPMFVNICECGGCVEIGFPGVRFLRARGDNGGDTNGLLRFNCNNSSQQMHPHSREFSLCRRNFGRYHQFGEKKFIKILRKSAGDIYQAIKTLWNKNANLWETNSYFCFQCIAKSCHLLKSKVPGTVFKIHFPSLRLSIFIIHDNNISKGRGKQRFLGLSSELGGYQRPKLPKFVFKGTVPQKIGICAFVQPNSFGWPGVNFHALGGGSNSTQISIFGVQCLRNFTTRGA